VGACIEAGVVGIGLDWTGLGWTGKTRGDFIIIYLLDSGIYSRFTLLIYPGAALFPGSHTGYHLID
jgi:hypothetical protein